MNHEHEAINMAEIPVVETSTCTNPALRHHGGPICFTDIRSRSPTSARPTPPTAKKIRIYRYLWTTRLDVLEACWGRTYSVCSVSQSYSTGRRKNPEMVPKDDSLAASGSGN